ncbi:MAG: cohesin domain-containing protein [Gammaproteobacteria bacterium]|jgi:hypothetical protein|nr:cohesin domain-containing protein [Gammaproteobacteria bacterium]
MLKPVQSLLLASSLLAAAALPAHAATVAAIPTSPATGVGGTLVVDVIALGLVESAAPSLSAYDIDLKYDPAILGFGFVTFGNGLDVLSLGGNLQVDDGSVPGTVSVQEVSFDLPDDLNDLQPGTFTLFSVSFTALSVGTSFLDVEIQSLADAFGLPLGAAVAGEATVVPLPAAAWLLAGALLPMLGFRRRAT